VRPVPFGAGFFLFATQRQGKSYLNIMIHLTKGNTETVVLTLNEKQTLASPNYLFRFVHRATNAEVSFVKLYADNISTFKDRYDEFSIMVNLHFANSEQGQWDYFIYEQTSSSNTDPLMATSLLEEGIMQLKESTAFTYTKHNPSNTFIVR
jgi:hypothetical protein